MIVTSLVLLVVMGVLMGGMYWFAESLQQVTQGEPTATPVAEPGMDASLLWESVDFAELKPLQLAEPRMDAELNRLRICTYNIENFTDGFDDGGTRTVEVAGRQAAGAAAILDVIDADLLVMQEVENTTILEVLNRNLKTPYAFVYVTDFHHRSNIEKLNIAVLSRLPLDGVMELDFGSVPGRNRPPRGVIRASLVLGDARELVIYGVHLKSNWGDTRRNVEKRQRALKIVAEDFKRLREERPGTEWEVMVLGDMNMDPDQRQFRLDTTLEPLQGFRDLWRGRSLQERTTLPTRYGDSYREFPPAAFDRVLANPGLEAAPWTNGLLQAKAAGVHTEDVNVQGGQIDGHVSDHYPVYVDLVR